MESDSDEEFEMKVKKKHKMKNIKKRKIYVDTEDPHSTINTLNKFISEFNNLKDIVKIFSNKNLNFFASLIENNDVKINLLLCKIYIIIISKDYLYKTFIPQIKENDESKINIILALVTNISLLIQNLNKFNFSYELFELKKKSLGLLNFLYNNCKYKLKGNEEKLNEIIILMNNLRKQYYSKVFNEFSQTPEIFEILLSRNINVLNAFESKFCQINSYFEQFEIFKKFVELNSNIELPLNNLSSEAEKNYLINFYEKYGSILLKFCVYHNFIFLNSEEENTNYDKDINKEITDKESKEKVNILFLKDSDNYYHSKNKNSNFHYMSKREKIQDLLSNKRFRSSLATKQYYDLIKKVINFYLDYVIQGLENHPKIKQIKENLIYFLNSFKVESYFPLYLKKLTSIVINDSFTESYISNVYPGEENRIYFNTNNNEDVVIYIEFYLRDKSKDISFELNMYDSSTNKFQNLYCEERTDETVRLFIFPHGFRVYELVFDNSYSWFNNKFVNYRISFLHPINEDKIDMIDTDDYFFVNRGKYYYEPKKFFKNNPNYKNIPLIIKENKLTTVKIKNNGELSFKENSEDEEIVSAIYFNYVLSRYFQKQTINNKKDIKISIFSQNNNLTKNKKFLKKELDECEDNKDKKYIENIGFIPAQEINKIKIIYTLYSLNEQIVINHKLLKHQKEKNNIKYTNNFLLLIYINKNILNTILFHKGEFLTKYSLQNSNEIDFKDFDINNENEIFEFINNINDNIKEIELILVHENDLEKKEIDLINKIKNYSGEKIYPPLPCVEYNVNDICINVIKYICS